MPPLPLANIFQPLIDVFEQVLLFFHDTVGLGWGLSIIALTVSIRALLIPLSLKQIKSMRALQAHAPELKKIQERHKGDRQKLNQETMRFYQENQINPLASCLPLLAQIPVFISLFYMLQDDLRQDICGQSEKPCGEVPNADGSESFFFVPDLTDNATGGVLITLLVLYVGSQLASTLLVSTITDKMQRRIFTALPFVFVPFILSFPAGLLVYWITTNLWTIVQQLVVRRIAGPPPTPAGALAGGGTTSLEKDDGPSPRLGRRPKPKAEPATQAAGATAARRSGPPPPPPRSKKKKRSGRRR